MPGTLSGTQKNPGYIRAIERAAHCRGVQLCHEVRQAYAHFLAEGAGGDLDDAEKGCTPVAEHTRFTGPGGAGWFIVDSGASHHMISVPLLTPEEQATVQQCMIPIDVLTANGVVTAHEEVTLYIPALDIEVTAYLLPGVPRSSPC